MRRPLHSEGDARATRHVDRRAAIMIRFARRRRSDVRGAPLGGPDAADAGARAAGTGVPHRHDRRAPRHRRARQARTSRARPAAGRDHGPRGRRHARGQVLPPRRGRAGGCDSRDTAEAGVVQPDPLRRITLVSLVFDHLSQNGRTLALKAAQDYLRRPMPPGQWTAVFTLDNRLHMQHDFSRDTTALLAAVERASTASRKRRRRCRRRAASRRARPAR